MASKINNLSLSGHTFYSTHALSPSLDEWKLGRQVTVHVPQLYIVARSDLRSSSANRSQSHLKHLSGHARRISELAAGRALDEAADDATKIPFSPSQGPP